MVRALTGTVRDQQETITRLQNGQAEGQGQNMDAEEEIAHPVPPMENLTAIKEFLKLKPPTFKGGMGPVQANEWIAEMEKNFQLLKFSDRQRVLIGSYLLIGEANH